MNATPILAAITAAGASSRMGEPKALLAWNQGTVLSTIIATLESAGLSDSLVVLGANAEAVGAEASRVGASTAVNSDWERGRFFSVRVAAEWARTNSQEAALLLWPVDCPGVSVDTVRALVDQAREEPGSNVVPSHEGRGGHPVVLCSETVRAIAAAEGDGNLREFVRGGGRLTMDVDDPAVIENINRPADYESAIQKKGT